MATTYSALMRSIQHTETGQTALTIPENWMQGRTTYGGLSAALCLEAALPLADGKPLRTAQVAFIGPVGGAVSLKAETLRIGKSSAFVGVDLIGEDTIGSRAIFTFGDQRQEQPSITPDLAAPPAPSPDQTPDFFPEGVGPSFIRNFQVQLIDGAMPMSGATRGEYLLWMRHADRSAPDDLTALLALGDAPPPAALALMTGPIRISSMNWSIDILTDTPQTDDGWWLARSTAETLENGYSSQAMTLWNSTGEPVMASRQTIAIFA